MSRSATEGGFGLDEKVKKGGFGYGGDGWVREEGNGRRRGIYIGIN